MITIPIVMRRRAMNLGTLLSLLLLLATASLWVRSYWTGDTVHRLDNYRGQYLDVCRGRVMYYAANTPIGRTSPEWGYIRRRDPAEQWHANDQIEARVAARTGNGFRALGLAFRGGWGPGRLCVIIIPLWAPALLFMILPALWLRGRRRVKPGHCRACGYDLRASPERCPECGEPAA